jgi:hypothetical protein
MSQKISQRELSMDIVFIGLILAFFALSWGFVHLCEKI